MGKYKDKNERHRAKNPAQKDCDIVPVLKVSGHQEDQDVSSNKANKVTNSDEDKGMTLGKIPKKRRFGKPLLVAANYALVIIAVYQMVVIHSQLDVMRKDQRAWMKVVGKVCHAPVIDQPLDCEIEMTNTGKTPALHFVSDTYIEVISNGSGPSFGSNTIHGNLIVGIIYPNVPDILPVIRVSNDG